MPVNLPNFLQAETRSYGPENLLESAIQGYQMSRIPAQTRMEEARQKELVQQLMHGNYKSGLENQYLPEKLSDEQIKRQIELRYQGPQAEAELQKALMANKLQEKYGEEAMLADIEHKRNLAKYSHYSHTPQSVRLAQFIQGEKFDPTSFETQRLVAGLEGQFIEDQNGQIKAGPVPDYFRPMMHYSPGQKTKVMDKQNKYRERIDAWQEVLPELDEADAIIDKYPGLSDTFAAVMAKANLKDKSYLVDALSKITDTEQRTAIQELDKIYSQVALNLDAAMPGRGSVARLNLTKRAKGDPFLTNEAAKFVNNSLRKQGIPWLRFKSDLDRAHGRYDIDFDKQRYSKNDDEVLSNLNKPYSAQADQLTNELIGEQEEPGGSKAKIRYEVIDEKGEKHLVDIALNEISELKKDFPNARPV